MRRGKKFFATHRFCEFFPWSFGWRFSAGGVFIFARFPMERYLSNMANICANLEFAKIRRRGSSVAFAILGNDNTWQKWNACEISIQTVCWTNNFDDRHIDMLGDDFGRDRGRRPMTKTCGVVRCCLVVAVGAAREETFCSASVLRIPRSRLFGWRWIVGHKFGVIDFVDFSRCFCTRLPLNLQNGCCRAQFVASGRLVIRYFLRNCL